MVISQEELQSIFEAITCRESQSNTPSPPILVVHGVEATGKTLTINTLLRQLDAPSAFVSCRDCITTRHLLERTLGIVREAVYKRSYQDVPGQTAERCESLSTFFVEMQRVLREQSKVNIVLDGIDRQREAVPTLLPALARLGEIIPSLNVVFIVTTPRPYLLHRTGVIYIHFPPYSKAEILAIASKEARPIHHESAGNYKKQEVAAGSNTDEDSVWLWTRFATAVWDALGQSAARDIVSFREVCRRLWPSFVQPILTEPYWPREFSKLMVKNRHLFQSETALIDSLLPPEPVTSTTTANPTTSKPASTMTLPYYPAHILIAAYLASHNPPRTDLSLFSKSSLSKRRKKRGGGGGATPNHKKSTSMKAHRKLSRRLLGPQPFVLERLFAIFHAIIAEDDYQGGSAELMGQFATLVSLRLIVRAGAGTADVLEGGSKWRCMVGWEFIRGIARDVGFDIEDFVVE